MLYVNITGVKKALFSKLSALLFDNQIDFKYSFMGGSLSFVIPDYDLSNGFLEKVQQTLNKRNHVAFGSFVTDSLTLY